MSLPCPHGADPCTICDAIHLRFADEARTARAAKRRAEWDASRTAGPSRLGCCGLGGDEVIVPRLNLEPIKAYVNARPWPDGAVLSPFSELTYEQFSAVLSPGTVSVEAGIGALPTTRTSTPKDMNNDPDRS